MFRFLFSKDNPKNLFRHNASILYCLLLVPVVIIATLISSVVAAFVIIISMIILCGSLTYLHLNLVCNGNYGNYSNSIIDVMFSCASPSQSNSKCEHGSQFTDLQGDISPCILPGVVILLSLIPFVLLAFLLKLCKSEISESIESAYDLSSIYIDDCKSKKSL